MVMEHEPDSYDDGIFELMPEWDKCINGLGITMKSNATF
jgi:hypothetical protein